MRSSALSLALLGLGTVQALPTKTTEDKRTPQIFGPPTTSFWPGDPPRKHCDPRFHGICVPFRPPREPPLEERDPQILGPPSSSFTPGDPPRSRCDPRFQGICIPIWPRPEGDASEERSEQDGPFIVSPGNSPERKKIIATLELQLERLQNKRHKTDEDWERIDALRSALRFLAGIDDIDAPPGSDSTFTPGKRGLVLPPDAVEHKKEVIAQLELQLERLQNKPHKTEDDYDTIDDIRSALRYLAGITSITAPPGTGTTFTPGKTKRDDKQRAIAELQRQLTALQNKPDKTDADLAMIAALQAMILYTEGIAKIDAPPGTNTSFTIGRRGGPAPSDGAGAYASECPGLKGAELALEGLMHRVADAAPSWEEYLVMKRLEAFLLACGVVVSASPDGTWTTLVPSTRLRARDFALPAAKPDLDPAGLERAYEALRHALGDARPSLTTWLALQHVADVLALYGIEVARTTTTTTTTTLVPADKARRDGIELGAAACRLAETQGMAAALAALRAAYGSPEKLPRVLYSIWQMMATVARACGGQGGWTELRPDPTVPGGEVHPSDRRSAPESLAVALRDLEGAYGTYGSGTIPAPVLLIMGEIVTILQAGGNVVKGWPLLGPGSTTIKPSD